ncbi:IclR family transcriptional regulator C-terminal domain-containing protein [Paraburkholderia silvatlantica]|uniref:helix-turn-helix domain-containing protein n=1 Tax=Paraburkholderia silvatlantica TaxID=321895 RepID=UPI003750DC12
MSETPPVSAVARSILLLRALNRHPKSTIDLLHTETGLAKSTISRMLQAFQHEGLVRRAQYGVYYLTSAVAELSSGYQGEPKIVEAAKSIADLLTCEVLWPVSIGVQLGPAAMWVCYTTSSASPLSFQESPMGMQLSLVSHAMGRAYLAFCPAGKRNGLIDAVKRSSREDDLLAGDRAHIDRIVDEVRRCGYALRDHRLRPDSATVAVPILEKRAAVGSIGLTWFSSTMSSEEAVRRYVPVLRAAAVKISANLRTLP